jgi:hypothetical protein
MIVAGRCFRFCTGRLAQEGFIAAACHARFPVAVLPPLAV